MCSPGCPRFTTAQYPLLHVYSVSLRPRGLPGVHTTIPHFPTFQFIVIPSSPKRPEVRTSLPFSIGLAPSRQRPPTHSLTHSHPPAPQGKFQRESLVSPPYPIRRRRRAGLLRTCARPPKTDESSLPASLLCCCVCVPDHTTCMLTNSGGLVVAFLQDVSFSRAASNRYLYLEHFQV